jgi:hypothetical protein
MCPLRNLVAFFDKHRFTNSAMGASAFRASGRSPNRGRRQLLDGLTSLAHGVAVPEAVGNRPAPLRDGRRVQQLAERLGCRLGAVSTGRERHCRSQPFQQVGIVGQVEGDGNGQLGDARVALTPA